MNPMGGRQMIPGNKYTYRFLSNIHNVFANDVILGYEQYETEGWFIGMTSETNYCIMVSEYGNNYRIHYVVKDSLTMRQCNMDDNARRYSSWLVANMYLYMQSYTYGEPRGYDYYTPVLFVSRNDLSCPREKEYGKKESREKIDDLETKNPNYCDMV